MLYWLLFQVLHNYIPAFRVFGYITTRVALANLTALFLALMLGPWMIRKLTDLSFGQHIREEGPQSHHRKAGTPTMGGLLIVASIVVPTILWANLQNKYIWIALLGLLGFGSIGFVDDYAKLMKRRNLGLTGKQKFWAQVACAMVIGFCLLLLHANQAYSTVINVPFFKQFKPDLLIEPLTKSYWTYPLAFVPFYLFIVFVMVGSSNSVNLTDGLDGLAIGLMIIASGAMTALTYVSSHAKFSDYLDLARLANSQELTIFCASIVGASLGFLWYNCHPAQMFMGDVGSMALGGALGIIAVLIKQEILLVFIGGIYVLEALSVILQVGSYKLRGGKRIFKMAPIHHHFEALGWAESKVIVRFWIAGLVMALFALATLKLR
ncbi:MAG: phospho-N-acetylmuramoyl-pentapeptide-transferase [Acidobacteriaceae bacterium]|nr:phospho-N-acetylmuramoyl-pentapeptide-transferase [Acidobacteriaceae bacterium]MBV9779544.1 phospho-N-acetylmuramoyl-pentapeptide-transferase [Acidobacteriaceae bacterium]